MTDSAIRDATSGAVTSIGAPVKAAGDAAVTALGSVIDTAAKRGRKARKRASKRARDEIGYQRRVIHKQARDAKKKSRKMSADFAEEIAARANNMVEAGKGGRVARHPKTSRVVAVLAAAGIAVVAVRKRQAARATTENPATSVS